MAALCYTSDNSLSSAGYPCSTHSFWIVSENIVVSHYIVEKQILWFTFLLQRVWV